MLREELLRDDALRDEERRGAAELRDDALLDETRGLLLRCAAAGRRGVVARLDERCGPGLARRTGSGRRAIGLLAEVLLGRMACLLCVFRATERRVLCGAVLVRR